MNDRLPPGQQPYDSLNGMRIGAIVGGIIGAIAVAFGGSVWIFLVGAMVGGVAGYGYERRQQANRD